MTNKNVGILFIDKPTGITSSLVDKICKRVFKLSKIGHLGTLDPFASGMLPLAFNGATKLIPYIKWTNIKTYIFDIEFGVKKDTGDITGNIVATTDIIPTKKQVENILPKFLGNIQQKPHIYSAIKINGRPAYDLARMGIIPDIKSKTVTIHDLKLLEKVTNEIYKFETTVSSGTYIRSLTEDIATMLGSLGYTKSLRRTKINMYNSSVTLDFIRNHGNNIDEVVNYDAWLSVTDILDDIPVVHVSDSEANDLRLGRQIKSVSNDGMVLVKSQNGFTNLSECQNGYLQPKKLIIDIGEN